MLPVFQFLLTIFTRLLAAACCRRNAAVLQGAEQIVQGLDTCLNAAPDEAKTGSPVSSASSSERFSGCLPVLRKTPSVVNTTAKTKDPQ